MDPVWVKIGDFGISKSLVEEVLGQNDYMQLRNI